jgi:uncharacterized protein YndB with AHSA1/START domain
METGAQMGKPSLQLSDEAVQAKTGKTWSEWLAVLDAAGARKKNRKEIVAYVSGTYRVGPWWRQMVTVGYEQARGMREPHQSSSGYGVSVSKTLPVSVAALYAAWKDEKTRSLWLRERSILIRKATAPKSMRVTWSDRKTNVDVYFYSKGNSRSQVVVQHGKLSDAKAVEKMKAHWSKALNRLKEVLET